MFSSKTYLNYTSNPVTQQVAEKINTPVLNKTESKTPTQQTKPLFNKGPVIRPVNHITEQKATPKNKNILNHITNAGNAISGFGSSLSGAIDQVGNSINNIKPEVKLGIDNKLLTIIILVVGFLLFKKPLMKLFK